MNQLAAFTNETLECKATPQPTPTPTHACVAGRRGAALVAAAGGTAPPPLASPPKPASATRPSPEAISAAAAAAAPQQPAQWRQQQQPASPRREALLRQALPDSYATLEKLFCECPGRGPGTWRVLMQGSAHLHRRRCACSSRPSAHMPPARPPLRSRAAGELRGAAQPRPLHLPNPAGGGGGAQRQALHGAPFFRWVLCCVLHPCGCHRMPHYGVDSCCVAAGHCVRPPVAPHAAAGACKATATAPASSGGQL